jgi:hypothetical protein
LKPKRTAHNGNIESCLGSKGVEVRDDKPAPITLIGNCRAPLGEIDGFRRLVYSDHQAGWNQPNLVTEIISLAINLEHIGDITDKHLLEIAAKKIKCKFEFSKEGAASERRERHTEL